MSSPSSPEFEPNRQDGAAPAIALSAICKRFAGVTALDGVSLTFTAGRIHGLLGENGAGKSTIMNVLYGLQRPDSGSVAINGKTVRLRSPRDARRHGIGMVHQHFALVPTLSLIENIELSLGRGWLGGHRQQLLATIHRLAQRLGWTLRMDGPVGRASVGQQQRLEILKALAAGGQTLILDEPTAVLAPQEVDDLLKALRTLADDGRTIILITHKLAEVERCCDTVAILRRGRFVHAGEQRDIDITRMAALMVGESAPPVPSQPAVAGEPVLIANNLILQRDDGGPAVNHACFTIRRGEITAIAGVDGNGQSELIEGLLGLRRIAGGTVAQSALRVAVIPDDRLRHAVIADASIRDNLLIRDGGRAPYATWWGWLWTSLWNRRARQLVADFDIRTPSIHARAGQLSGGNQQKVVIARELAEPTDLVIAVNPTRGLDIAASRFVFDRLLAARAGGAGILLVHSDLDELLTIADRVAVMHGGELTPTDWPTTDRTSLGRLMMGLEVAASA